MQKTDMEKLADSYREQGSLFWKKKEPADAEACFENAIRIYKELNVQEEGTAWSALEEGYMDLLQLYGDCKLYVRVEQLEKRIREEFRCAPDAISQKLESRIKSVKSYPWMEEPGAEEACLWAEAEKYEKLALREAGMYDRELLELYQKLSVLYDGTVYHMMNYTVSKFMAVYQSFSGRDRDAADSCMESFCKELLREKSGLLGFPSDFDHKIYENILDFVLCRKDAGAFPERIVGRLYSAWAESMIRTAYEKELTGNIELALRKAIRIFRDEIEAGASSDFGYAWSAYCQLSILYNLQSDREKTAEILDEAKQIIEKGMERDQPAFAPYLARYYHWAGSMDIGNGASDYHSSFGTAAGLFRSLLESDQYTDSEKEAFQFHLDEMDQEERDIYWKYM